MIENYFVDPSDITNYECNDAQLESHILFWILAAGKNGKISAKNLNNFLLHLNGKYGNLTPFELIRQNGIESLPERMKFHGIGCFNRKSVTIWNLVNSQINLRECSFLDLEKIKGIGKKTSHAFILHTRKGIQHVVADRHVLCYLKDLGYKVPNTTPQDEKEYSEVEQLFLSVVPEGFTASEYDLLIWRIYSNS